VICRREVVTGSNRQRRVCTTHTQREETADRTQQLQDKLNDRRGQYQRGDLPGDRPGGG